MSIRHFILAGASAMALAACGDKAEEAAEAPVEEVLEEAAAGEVPSVEEAEAAIAEQLKLSPEETLARTEKFLTDNAAQEGVVVTDSGLQFLSMQEGEGKTPADNDVVVIHFIGTLADGNIFDTSLTRGVPATIKLSEFVNQVPGFVEGIRMMKVGGAAKLVIPPALAYGEEGMPDGTIGPNEVLIFEVQLLEAIDEDTVAQLEEEYNAVAEQNLAAGQAFLAQNAGKAGVTVTDSGLQYEVVERSGSDVSPVATDTVEVHYKGTIENGTVFDSSYDRDETATFPLNGVIRGWTEGLQLMNEGDKFRFYIPSDLGYGPQARGDVIGPNQMLIFDVELIDVKEPEAAEAPAE